MVGNQSRTGADEGTDCDIKAPRGNKQSFALFPATPTRGDFVRDRRSL
ncbi:hypothetical protein RSAG8_00188, partial [Rhizoctonia solani AG-8 WAC10335]